jgi:hypothetical protein
MGSADLADFWEEEEERIGCSWVKSSSNSLVFLRNSSSNIKDS